MGTRSDKGIRQRQTDSSATPAAARITITGAEKVVTDYIKAYLNGRERWIKWTLIAYGILIAILIAWFSIISSYLIEWNNYKQRANQVLKNSEQALEDWKKQTGIDDGAREKK